MTVKQNRIVREIVKKPGVSLYRSYLGEFSQFWNAVCAKAGEDRKKLIIYDQPKLSRGGKLIRAFKLIKNLPPRSFALLNDLHFYCRNEEDTEHIVWLLNQIAHERNLRVIIISSRMECEEYFDEVEYPLNPKDAVVRWVKEFDSI